MRLVNLEPGNRIMVPAEYEYILYTVMITTAIIAVGWAILAMILKDKTKYEDYSAKCFIATVVSLICVGIAYMPPLIPSLN